MNLQALGGRRFLLALGAGVMTWLLCWFGKVSGEIYATVVIATVGGFITGNVWEANMAAKAGKAKEDGE